jgi:hypothetical protein
MTRASSPSSDEEDLVPSQNHALRKRHGVEKCGPDRGCRGDRGTIGTAAFRVRGKGLFRSYPNYLSLWHHRFGIEVAPAGGQLCRVSAVLVACCAIVQGTTIKVRPILAARNNSTAFGFESNF